MIIVHSNSYPRRGQVLVIVELVPKPAVDLERLLWRLVQVGALAVTLANLMS